jgi:glycosyltransferase involved in cell wall biosynthesis
MPLANAAIDYYPAAFSTGGERLMGREAAGEGFLRAFLRYADVQEFHCFTGQQAEVDQFVAAAHSLRPGAPVRWLPRGEASSLAAAGCLFHPDPVLRGRAWERRHFDQTAYSLCGVTHTICTAAVMDAVGGLLTDPLYPWDALICTSSVVKASVQRLLGHWSDYLSERLGAMTPATVELPVIPLGVDCASFEDSRHAQLRRDLRFELGIDAEAIVVLYLGRLVFHAKAHPLPMFLALEEATRRSGRAVCLIQAGWFPNAAIEAEFKARNQAHCPSVKTIYIDGRRPEYRGRLWHAADVFVSLADNIQETFGLSPIEAMAAGLPVVVSDWDGYRDTVRHGVDGFRVPTITAPAGSGGGLALRYALGEEDYDRYIGTASLCTAVDVAECAEAFSRLFAGESLRRTMGAAGRERARERFDWKHIVRAYQELWHELGQRRRQAVVPQREPSQPADPLREDPFALFSTYPTAQLTGDCVVARLGSDFDRRLDQLYRMPMMNFAGAFFATQEESRQLLASLERGPCTVEELVESSAPGRRDVLMRTTVWLAKGGLLQFKTERTPLAHGGAGPVTAEPA